MAELVSKIYSDALFDVALEMNAVERIQSEFDFLSATLKENSDFYELIKTPRVSVDEKKALLEETFKSSFSEPFMNFIKILMDKKRGPEVLNIKKAFDQRVDEHNNIAKATVESVLPLSASQMADLTQKLGTLSGKKVSLTNVVNPSLVGGLLVTMGDRVIDGSIKYKLETMLENLNQIII